MSEKKEMAKYLRGLADKIENGIAYDVHGDIKQFTSGRTIFNIQYYEHRKSMFYDPEKGDIVSSDTEECIERAKEIIESNRREEE